MFDLSGKVAVLTGVGSGIGKATAITLAAAGATIVGGDIDEVAAQATADETRRPTAATASVRRTDVTQRADVDALVDHAAAEFGRVDIVGNIAGVPHNKMVAECSDEEFERILAINLKSVFYGCQAAIRHMIPQGSGCIVNISSGAIDTPAPTLACYGMTKAAVAMLTKTLATEVGRHGIRVERDRAGHDPHELLAPQLHRRRRQRRAREARAVPQARERDGAARPGRRSARRRELVPLPRLRRGELHHRARSNAPTAASRCPGSRTRRLSERGPSGPARGDAGRSDQRGAEPGVDPSTRAKSGKLRQSVMRRTLMCDSTGGPVRVPVR